MPKATVRRKRVNLGVLVLHVPIGWEVKPLTAAQRKARRKDRDARREKRRKEQLDRWKVAGQSRPAGPPAPKRSAAKKAPASVWHQPAQRAAKGAKGVQGTGRPTPDQLRAAGLCGAPTQDGGNCLNSKNCPIPKHRLGRP